MLINCNFINSNEMAVIFSNDNGMISNCDFKDNFANENSHHTSKFISLLSELYIRE